MLIIKVIVIYIIINIIASSSVLNSLAKVTEAGSRLYVFDILYWLMSIIYSSVFALSNKKNHAIA